LATRICLSPRRPIVTAMPSRPPAKRVNASIQGQVGLAHAVVIEALARAIVTTCVLRNCTEKGVGERAFADAGLAGQAHDLTSALLRPRSRPHQHVFANNRRLHFLRRIATVMAILQAA
jgi:hypothetical protein